MFICDNKVIFFNDLKIFLVQKQIFRVGENIPDYDDEISCYSQTDRLVVGKHNVFYVQRNVY